MVHPPKQQSVLQMAQAEMKWDKQEQLQINILTKLEGNGMKDKKIKELANRCKMLNLAFEKEKTM